MVQIKQDELQKALLLYYHQQLHEVLEESFLLEQKYEMSFEQFSNKLEAIEGEELEIEDDYIEWKAALSFANTYYQHINHIENGLFEVVE